ncbi:Hypothetical predicted protein [Paramuricea clavata]|uniref:Uncharacterized protein n=1 Tax=Paramuricea clavata TaxID=317549 RepID=A0A6S7KTC3_PARCT|nr:Hypothetical predicted protein [Paramuricea clavata]
MAARKRNVLDYQQLDSLSSVVLYDTPRKKRKVLPRKYSVERIISKRKIKGEYEYLIKWDGWPLTACSWEPSSHLDEELLRGYEIPPTPHPERLETACRQFYQAITTSLRSKSVAPTYIPMDLDLWRYIINGKGRESNHKGFSLYSVKDLARLRLPEHWWYTLDKYGHGEGRGIQQLKIKPVLSWTPKHQIFKDGKLTDAPQMPIEKLCIDILRRCCNTHNLNI